MEFLARLLLRLAQPWSQPNLLEIIMPLSTSPISNGFVAEVSQAQSRLTRVFRCAAI